MGLLYLSERGWVGLKKGQEGFWEVMGGSVGVYGCLHIVLATINLIISTCFIKLTYNRQMVFFKKNYCFRVKTIFTFTTTFICIKYFKIIQTQKQIQFYSFVISNLFMEHIRGWFLKLTYKGQLDGTLLVSQFQRELSSSWFYICIVTVGDKPYIGLMTVYTVNNRIYGHF